MGTTLSIAGTDVDVGVTAGSSLALFAVRPTFGATPGDAGFTLRPIVLPITVNQIDPKGPAAASGLVSGDHLVTIDGQSLQGLLPQGASYLIQNHRPGTSVVLGIERAGGTRTITIAVGD
jgi:S1-C subfamily serine protease